MGWTVVYEADRYIERLGSCIRIVEGRAERIPDDEQHGQETFEFSKGQKPRFLVDIDLVIEGDCGRIILEKASLQFPLGVCIPEAGKQHEPAKSWLHEVVRSHTPKSILFVPGCCGQYDEERQDLIRRAFPEIQMYFPRLGDYCDCIHERLDRVCNDLIKANVLGGA